MKSLKILLSLAVLLFASQAMNAQNSRKENRQGKTEKVDVKPHEKRTGERAKVLKGEKAERVHPIEKDARKKKVRNAEPKATKAKAKANRSDNRTRGKGKKKGHLKSRTSTVKKGSKAPAKRHKLKPQRTGS